MGVWAWLTDPANWTGPNGVPARTVEHVVIAGFAMLLGIVVALPVGIWLGHVRRAAFLTTSIGNLGRAIPTLAILVILASIPAIGVGDLAAILALAVFSIPPMLTSAYVGVRDVDPDVRDAARGMGMTGGQVLRGVELPLAAPSILSGVRTSLVQVVATVSLAALVGSGGLGRYVVDGFARQDQTLVLVGALLVSILAVATDRAAGWGTRLLSPRGIRSQARGAEADELAVARVPDDRTPAAKGAALRWAGAYGVMAVVVAGGLLMAGGRSQEGQVTIAAFNFGESKVMASLYAGMLEDIGVDVSVSELSSREVISPALEAGEVDAVPEYLGTYTEFLNKQVNGPDAPAVANSDVAETLAAGRGLADPLGITLAEPALAADQNAFAVTREFAETHSLRTVSDLAAFSQGSPVVLGGPPECPTRPFCQPGLEEVYGAQIKEFVPLDAGGPLTKQALSQGAIDVGLVFSSDGGVSALDLVVLEDDKALQTVDNLVPALSERASTPQIIAALNRLAATLTTEDLIELNRQVDIERRPPKEVAAEYLLAKDLVAGTP
jgi:ABC-type proline/glycine betaine transport system permease subunit/glycine betaine/choline ABC-type transport system substrate-binding protein